MFGHRGPHGHGFGGHGRHGHGRHGHGREVPRRARLQRRLFLWFGATIALTALVAGTLVGTLGPGARHWREDFGRFRALAEAELGRSWHDELARGELVRDISRAFQADVTVLDGTGKEIDRVGRPCRHGYSVEVREGDRLLGTVHGCVKRPPRAPLGFLIGLFSTGVVLWGASAVIARRLTRPLAELERVTRAIGSGDLGARVRLGRHQPGEVGALADSVSELAERIEHQLKVERELLAAVSHEVRSPLARLRVLVELAGSEGVGSTRLAEIEAEIVGLDALIGKLLASSRLEFGTLTRTTLGAGALARRAIEGLNLPLGLLDDSSDGALLDVDPTLVGRALGNLLENAVRHAGGVERLSVTADGERVRFEVLDRGPGFAKEVLDRAFEPFYSTGATAASNSSSLGLGLSLVSRIAKAHGGRAFAENREDGGARAVLELPVRSLS
jgi:signal transduction histidine kinase